MGTVVIVGGHGKIALLCGPLLRAAGHLPVGVIRSSVQAADLVAADTVPLVLDLERASPDGFAKVLRGRAADAVLFAAGAGSGASAQRHDAVDRGAAVISAEGAQLAGVRRYLQISTLRADSVTEGSPFGDPEGFAVYLRAKWAAEQDLRAHDLDWTILRPATLTDDPPNGHVRLAGRVENDPVARSDVAAVLAALLDAPQSVGRTLELSAGPTAIAAAVAALE